MAEKRKKLQLNTAQKDRLLYGSLVLLRLLPFCLSVRESRFCLMTAGLI